ncbi:MAG: UDP-2,3-diacylglucosamine diphosphatase [Bacteroidota bacterium]|jgi:UDP-2,3-diacylglucosamine hydrolase
MSKVYFISDAHLGLGPEEEERGKERRIIAFLDSIANDANQLFIVGDLFDAWFEYRTVMPKGYHRLLTKLEDLVLRDIKVHYLVGNHDFWIRNYFHDRLGMTVYRHAFETTIDGKRFFIHHGDGLANNDTGYKILKKILRNPLAMWLYSWVHPDIGVALAGFSSKKSRQYTAEKHYGEEDGMVKFAAEKIRQGIDVVIMGHRHQPVVKEMGKGLYVNLGDWIEHNTYAEAANGVVSLKTWKP